MTESAWEKQKRMDAIANDPLYREALLRLVEPELRRLKIEREKELKAQQERDAKEQKKARVAWIKERMRVVQGEISPNPERLRELDQLKAEYESLKEAA